MKTILLTRHAKTIQPEGDMKDFDRYLLPRGHKDPVHVSREITDLGIIPDKIFTSPAKRAVQTAEIFADRFSIDRRFINEIDFLYSYFSLDRLVEYLDKNASKFPCVQVIGHNPKMEELAADFTASVYRRIPTTGTVVVEFEVNKWSHIMNGSGRLLHFITAKSLRK